MTTTDHGAKDRRPYLTVTLEFFDHPKTLALSDAAGMHVLRLWAYCGRYLTDGMVPEPVAKSKGPKVLDELLAGGWLTRDDTGALWCHDYLRHQPSRSEVEARAAAKATGRARGGRYGAHRRWHEEKGRVDPACEFCSVGEDPGPDPMA